MINIFVLSKLLGENYEKLVKSKKGKTFLKEYVNTIKNNRFLKESIMFYSLIKENDLIDNDDTCEEFVDGVSKVFSNIPKSEKIDAYNKIEDLVRDIVGDDIVSTMQKDCCNDMCNDDMDVKVFIISNCNDDCVDDVLRLSEAKKDIVKFLKNKKKGELDNKSDYNNIVESMVSKFNQKYTEKLSESEKKLLKKALSCKTESDREDIIKEIREDCSNKVNSLLKEHGSEDIEFKEKLLEVKEKILFMESKDYYTTIGDLINILEVVSNL